MDTFNDYASSLDSPARSASQITGDDVTDLPYLTRAVYVGFSGDIAVEMADGQPVLFQNVPAGSILPVRAKKISQTGTTASGLVGLW